MEILQTLAPIVIKHGLQHASKKLNSPSSDLAREAADNNTHAMRTLLSRHRSISRGPALVSAATAGQLSALDLLLEAPESSTHHHYPHEATDPNTWANGTTPLLAAVKEHHVKTTTTLLDAGADPNLGYRNGTTALHEAAQAGDVALVKLLLQAGAKIDHHDQAGDTALILASRWGRVRVAKALIDAGANVEGRNAKGSTSLLVAARHDQVEVVELLLKEGADVHVRDRQGRGVLHRAVAGVGWIDGVPVSVKERIVAMLLRAGADPGVRDEAGKTASERAGWVKGDGGLKRLLESGRRVNSSRGGGGGDAGGRWYDEREDGGRKYGPSPGDPRRRQTF